MRDVDFAIIQQLAKTDTDKEHSFTLAERCLRCVIFTPQRRCLCTAEILNKCRQIAEKQKNHV